MAQSTVTRNVYARIFRGALEDISDAVNTSLIGSLFDKTYMPALLVDNGEVAAYQFTLQAAESVSVVLPQGYDSAERLYVAVTSSKKSKITVVSPTHGTRAVALLGTDSSTEGTHAAFWTWQGDVTSLTILASQETEVQVFLYQIPDLDDYESYFDKQIGLGVSGSE